MKATPDKGGGATVGAAGSAGVDGLDRWLERALDLALLLFCVAMLFDGRTGAKNLAFYAAALVTLLRLARSPVAYARALVGAPLFLPALALLAAGLWGSLWAPDPGLSWTRFFHRDNIGSGAAMAIMVGVLPRAADRARRLAAVSLAVLAIANGRQIAFLAEHPVFLDPDAYPYSVLWTAREFGELLLVLAPWVWAAGTLFRHPRLPRLASLWSLGILVLLLPAGYRGACLGMAAGAMVWFGYRRRWRPMLLGLATVLAVAVAAHLVWPDSLISRALGRAADDNLRVEGIWKPTAELISLRPVVGYGFDEAEFRSAYLAARPRHPQWPFEAISDAHSNGLAFVVAAGLPGGAAYLLGVGSILVLLVRRVRAARDEAAALPLALLASWVAAFAVLGQLDMVNWNYFGYLLAATAALICPARQTPARRRRVLFIIRDKLGDSLLAFATVQAYRRLRGDDDVTLLMRGDYARLVAGEAGFSLVVYRNGLQARLWALAQRLACCRYDAVVVLRGFGPQILQLGRLIPASRRISFSATQSEVFPEAPPPFTSDDWPLIDASWRAAALLEPALPRPDRLALPSLQRSKGPGRFIGLCPVTDEKRKDLTAAALRPLIDQLRRSSDLPIRILVRNSGEAFRELGCEVVEFRDLGRLCREYQAMAAYWGADTGLYHLAVAMDIPATVIFGPTQPGRVILPRQRATAVRLAVLEDGHCDVKRCRRPLCIEQACRNLGDAAAPLDLGPAPEDCPLRRFPAAALTRNRRLDFPAGSA